MPPKMASPGIGASAIPASASESLTAARFATATRITAANSVQELRGVKRSASQVQGSRR